MCWNLLPRKRSEATTAGTSVRVWITADALSCARDYALETASAEALGGDHNGE